MDRVRSKLGRLVILVFDKIVLGNHLNVRIVRIDMDRTAQGNGYRAISSEQSPPDALPQPFVGTTKL